MPTIREDDVLRVQPGQDQALVDDGDAVANTVVEILGTSEVDTPQDDGGSLKVSWTKVRLFDPAATPEGWIRSSRVDLAGTPPGGPLDKLLFARQCWVEALFTDTNPHYVAAVAEMHSATSRDRQSVGGVTLFGPLLFSQAEWDAARAVPEFKVSTFTARDIADWRMQISLYALMARRTEQALTSELDTIAHRQPTWAELYLASLIGAKAAAAAVTKSPTPTIKQAFDGVAAAAQAQDRPLGMANFADIVKRHTEIFGNDGSVAGDLTIDHIMARLDPVLATTKDNIITAGTELQGAVVPGSTINGSDNVLPNRPGAPGSVINPPAGNVPGGVPNAGGVLGELISRGEGDYGTFNRGNAGDNPHQKINFANVAMSDLMALQALPKGDPRRLFAVGKYQVIPLTMKLAVSSLGIGPNEKYGPKLQETIFRRYLVANKRPQVKAYITGASQNLEAAQLALAQEFASVADPHTGRSFFDKIGGNKASISAQQAANAMNAERAKFQQNLATMDARSAWEALSPGML